MCFFLLVDEELHPVLLLQACVGEAVVVPVHHSIRPVGHLRLRGTVGLSGPGRELMPIEIGARKYPLTSVCQPAGSASSCSSGGTKAGGVTELGGGCALAPPPAVAHLAAVP